MRPQGLFRGPAARIFRMSDRQDIVVSAPRPMPRRAALVEARSKLASASFHAEPHEPLLYAALRAGVAVPYECATGTCGTCKARRLAGVTVGDWGEAPGKAFLRADRDEVLLCQTRALSEASIELDPPLDFDAGQFAVLRAPHITGYRGYSMVNHPGRAKQATFVVKRKPDGALTDWLFSRARPGDPIEWFGPLGRAIFTPQEQRTIVCIGGGSGIASIISILEIGCSSRHFEHFEAAVFFGIRTGADAFYLDRLERFAQAFPKTLTVTVALSHDEPRPDLSRRYPGLK